MAYQSIPNPLPTSISQVDVFPATQNITAADAASTSTPSANNQSLVTGSPTANSAASFALSGQNTIRVQVTGGLWAGTLVSEISVDGGTTWVAQGLHQGAYTTSTFTGNFVGGANVSGATNYRVRASAFTAGTATVKVTETVNDQSVYIANAGPSGNVISVLNSSTATLTSGSVFTGTAEEVTNFSEVRVSVIASHASATNGLSIQQSSDGTNWDVTDNYTIAAATASTFLVPRQARYFRVVYTNGGTNQTSFRLQTILNRMATGGSSQRPQDTYTNETDLGQVWSFNSVYNGSTWDRARGVNGALNTNNTAQTTGGYTPGKLISAATTNATTIKASAGTLGYITASNVNAAARYLKIYNKASAPTVGTDTPVHTFIIPGNTAGTGTNIPLPGQGIALGTGISFAITTGIADSDTTAVAANEIAINYGWI